jgi:hypothetical protein
VKPLLGARRTGFSLSPLQDISCEKAASLDQTIDDRERFGARIGFLCSKKRLEYPLHLLLPSDGVLKLPIVLQKQSQTTSDLNWMSDRE